ncbi:MAG: LicD family protein, partial [Muribaculaceae bacterium]|nr:LicD family protein [Muribaculaceae bacterium]
TNDTDPNYFYFFAKLRDTRSFLDEGAYDRAFKYRGVFIDIFPFDKVSLPLQRIKLQSYAYTLYRNGSGSDSALRKIRALTWFNRHVSFPVLRAFSRLIGGKTLTYDFGIPFHIVYDEKDIFPLATHDFEGVQLSVPGNSDHMLQSQFGDYMKLPNLDNVEHHVERLVFLDE